MYEVGSKKCHHFIIYWIQLNAAVFRTRSMTCIDPEISSVLRGIFLSEPKIMWDATQHRHQSKVNISYLFLEIERLLGLIMALCALH